MSILVVGSANTDSVMQVKKMPKKGETILASKFLTVAGGKGANQAIAISRLGEEVYLLASIGKDNFGDKLIQSYNRSSINTELIYRPNCASGVAVIYVEEEGENSIAVSPGSNLFLSPDNIFGLERYFSLAKFVISQLEVPINTVLSSAIVAKRNRAKFILNPAPAQSLPREIFPLIDIITPNETEASILTGIDVVDESSAIAAAHVLYKTGVKNVIITLGGKGALLYNNTDVKIVSGYNVNPVDSTAAGDTFNGALVYSLYHKNSILDSIVFANKAAALSVMRIGAHSSIPNLQEVESFSNMFNI
jgi:ribokinase